MTVSNTHCIVSAQFCLVIYQLYNLGPMFLLGINTFDVNYHLSQGTRFNSQKFGLWSQVFRILHCHLLAGQFAQGL